MASFRRIGFLGIVLSLFLLVTLPTPGTAQGGQQSSAPPSELAEINETLSELVGLVRLSLRAQEAELFLKRLEIARRSADPLERDLHALQKDRESLNETIAETTSMMEQTMLQIESAVEDGGDSNTDREQIRRMVDHWELRQDSLERRRMAIDQRIIDLENRLRVERAQVATLEQRIDELLGLN